MELDPLDLLQFCTFPIAPFSFSGDLLLEFHSSCELLTCKWFRTHFRGSVVKRVKRWWPHAHTETQTWTPRKSEFGAANEITPEMSGSPAERGGQQRRSCGGTVLLLEQRTRNSLYFDEGARHARLDSAGPTSVGADSPGLNSARHPHIPWGSQDGCLDRPKFRNFGPLTGSSR